MNRKQIRDERIKSLTDWVKERGFILDDVIKRVSCFSQLTYGVTQRTAWSYGIEVANTIWSENNTCN